MVIKKRKVADPRVTRVVSEITKVYNDSLKSIQVSKGDLTRMRYLRPSALPFCPVNFFVKNAEQGPLRIMHMEMAFYVKIGTVVHSVVQNYLARSGKFLATWKCKVCGNLRKVSMDNMCCDTPMQYREVLIKYKGVVGHIDAIYLDANGDYWILDYKTTSVSMAKKKASNPGVSYQEQIEAYALMLKLQYGIKVKGVLLMFIKRDSPREPVFFGRVLDKLDFPKIAKRINAYKKLHKEVLRIETLDQALAMHEKYGKCKNPMCDTCGSWRSAKDAVERAFNRGKRMGYLPLIDVCSK